jgi:hypothetical protein
MRISDERLSTRKQDGTDVDVRSKRRRDIEKFVADEFSNLDGFDLLDEDNRFEVIFPPGWKKVQKPSGY